MSLKDFLNAHQHNNLQLINHNFAALVQQRAEERNEIFLTKIHAMFQDQNVLLNVYHYIRQHELDNPQVETTQARLYIEFLLAHQMLYWSLRGGRGVRHVLMMISVYFSFHKFTSLTISSHDELARTLGEIYMLYHNHPDLNIQVHQFTVTVEEMLRIFFRRLNNDTAPPTDIVTDFWRLMADHRVDIFGLHSAYGNADHLTFLPNNDNFVEFQSR